MKSFSTVHSLSEVCVSCVSDTKCTQIIYTWNSPLRVKPNQTGGSQHREHTPDQPLWGPTGGLIFKVEVKTTCFHLMFFCYFHFLFLTLIIVSTFFNYVICNKLCNVLTWHCTLCRLNDDECLKKCILRIYILFYYRNHLIHST